ncbi:hypothetical protein GCM10008985_16340 [Halococcus dombrowskii]|uniref:Uncharacterized protein n=1 Tax=Halococcus dombrowskii TaxID=179637 RepID=A0AAV3SFG2_HALDO
MSTPASAWSGSSHRKPWNSSRNYKTATGKIQKFQLAGREAEYYRERDNQAGGQSDFNATYWVVAT